MTIETCYVLGFVDGDMFATKIGLTSHIGAAKTFATPSDAEDWARRVPPYSQALYVWAMEVRLADRLATCVKKGKAK